MARLDVTLGWKKLWKTILRPLLQDAGGVGMRELPDELALAEEA
jgi:hypothetical protein